MTIFIYTSLNNKVLDSVLTQAAVSTVLPGVGFHAVSPLS